MEQGLAHCVEMQLVDDKMLVGKGYVVFTGNFYPSPSQLQNLAKKGFVWHCMKRPQRNTCLYTQYKADNRAGQEQQG